MTFLNATLMFGMAAIAVPIVLHLIAKREPRRVVFPSVLFLTRRLETNRTRLRVRRWWLLAMRIAALAALALALARPVIHQSLSLTWLTIGLLAALAIALLAMATVALSRSMSSRVAYGLGGAGVVVLLAALLWGGVTYASGTTPRIDETAPVAIAIVLDNAPTSAWKTASDDRINRMKSIATWMVTRLPATSRIAIVDRSGTPVAFSLDLASAVSKIDQLRPLHVTAPIAPRIDASVRLIRTSELESRQILVITDLAEPTWRAAQADPALVSLLGEDPAVQLSLFDLGEFTGTNRSLSVPSMADATPPRGSPVSLSTTLELPSADNDAPISVTAELEMYEADPALPVIRNGVVQRPELRSADRTSVEIAPGGASELRLTIPPLEVGSHHGVIRLVGDDANGLDDTRYFTVQVLPPSRVLLVADNADEAKSIDLTINAAPFPVDETNAEYLVERIGFADLPVVRLQDFDTILLLDPPRDVIADESIAQFAAGGGGVLVCLGASAGDESLESAIVPALVRRWRSPEPYTFLEPLRPSHPVLAPLSEISGGVPWNGYRVQQYWQVNPLPSDKVLMRYAGTKHAAVIERSIPSAGGLPGYVIVTTTPLPDLVATRNQWNDLFGSDAWPAFFLVRNIVERLTGRGADSLMSTVGQPQIVRLPVREDDETTTVRLQLYPPGDAPPVPINVRSDAREIAVSDVSRVGTYWLRGFGANLGFSANLPKEATQTKRIDAGELNQWFGPDSYSLVTNQDEIELAEVRATQRVSLRSPLMLLALLVFLLELVLGNRFYRARAGGDQSAPRSAQAA